MKCTSVVPRRAFVAGAATLVIMGSTRARAQPEDYPSRAVRVVVAFTAGGTTDILARAVGQKLTERFKQPFVIGMCRIAEPMP